MPLPGRKRISARGVSHFQSLYFVIVLLSLFYFVLFASLYQKHKKIVPIIVVIFVALLLSLTMLLPKYTLKDLSIGSGYIIGRDNIDEFFNYVSKHKEFEDRSLAELAPNYETAVTSLVHMLEGLLTLTP